MSKMEINEEILTAINNNLARLVLAQQANAYINYMMLRNVSRDKGEFIDPIGKEYERLGVEEWYDAPEFL